MMIPVKKACAVKLESEGASEEIVQENETFKCEKSVTTEESAEEYEEPRRSDRNKKLLDMF